MSLQMNPYINFDGKARRAMEFYKSVLGGELTISTMGEGMPGAGKPDNIMHAQLISGDITIMASDHTDPRFLEFGNNIHLSVSGTDEKQLREYFDGLSAGGEVEYPLDKAPWGDTFGSFTDKFEIHWMFNIHHEL